MPPASSQFPISARATGRQPYNPAAARSLANSLAFVARGAGPERCIEARSLVSPTSRHRNRPVAGRQTGCDRQSARSQRRRCSPATRPNSALMCFRGYAKIMAQRNPPGGISSLRLLYQANIFEHLCAIIRRRRLSAPTSLRIGLLTTDLPLATREEGRRGTLADR